MKRRMRDGTITKLGEGRYWARAPRDSNGKRAPLGVWPTREEARQRIDAAKAKPPAPAAPAATGRMRVIRELRPLGDTGNVFAYVTFETNDELEREYRVRLDGELEAWRRARELRAYLKEMWAVLDEMKFEPPDGGELDTWLEWCDLQLSQDPIEELRYQVREAQKRSRR